ncbi:c-type cytochrome [Biformimicrobium ophioploci]|uniref:C-type cytochrome n=1 Tax=Biformimicrobium ophioploci TaxID=3036711 RepID=A0ABQ6LVA4_9GAMM|nr:c-type cytochrome [Microbulbifer sp. NKW57]GMG85994.1 c-type cytochrome [Microbulbifer sp. NKW57]
MNSIIKLAVLALGMVAGASGAMAAGDAAAGEAKVAACAACHGPDGNSPAPTFPKIAGLGEKYLLKQLKDVQSGERKIPEMIGQLDNFNDQDLADIAAFYASKTMQLSGAKAISVRLNNGEDVDGLALAHDVYRAGNADSGVPACMGCHSPTGKGNAPAGYPALAGQYPEYIEKQLRAFRAGERTNDGETRVMRSVAKQLSDAEIKSLAQYIAGLKD